LLPIVDNFERALAASQQAKDFDALLKGIEMTAKQLDQVLEQEGLKAIETVGQPFNPEFHQAIMQVESEGHEEGIIVEEIQKGYILKEKVIRPAMVKVSM
jgi:molecular chaperone GrpE